MDLDLDTIAASDTADLHLRAGNDALLYTSEGQKVEVVVYGPGTEQFQTAKSDHENRLLNRMQRRGSKSELSAEEKRRTSAIFLADVTKEFRNVTMRGMTGRDLALAVYQSQPHAFIADQVWKFSHDWANFSKTSATN